MDDYRMLSRGSSFKPPLILYFVSRISCAGFLVSFLLAGPAEIDISCQMAWFSLKLFFVLIVGSTTGLFCLRARVVCLGHPLIRAFLLGLWLACVGSCFLVFVMLDGVKSPDNGVSSCLVKVNHSFEAGIAIVITAMVHDTAVFVVISWKLYQFIHPSNLGHNNHKPVVFLVPTLSAKSSLWNCILQDGQLFYLIALIWQVLIIVLLSITSLGLYYRLFMVPVHLIVVSSMACHVFRNVRLGRFREEIISSSIVAASCSGPIHFAPDALTINSARVFDA
ncbi:hypothetical protein K435DRAFT_159838 [Dendrothele bispora CBS 962.96]|uniref:Uncharacterized protein n=1 Tax=Dendrothele bispora (strain CBS 962.96) TaxID=1314807 RepID=A0A4S8MQX5_DENBC|nr:hypothetical protein K435DRAFT_159838 [Dendrothele bispora CBS 962.96]